MSKERKLRIRQLNKELKKLSNDYEKYIVQYCEKQDKLNEEKAELEQAEYEEEIGNVSNLKGRYFVKLGEQNYHYAVVVLYQIDNTIRKLIRTTKYVLRRDDEDITSYIRSEDIRIIDLLGHTEITKEEFDKHLNNIVSLNVKYYEEEES